LSLKKQNGELQVYYKIIEITNMTLRDKMLAQYAGILPIHCPGCQCKTSKNYNIQSSVKRHY